MALGLLDGPSIASMNFDYFVSLKGSYCLRQHATKEKCSLLHKAYFWQGPGSAIVLSVTMNKRISISVSSWAGRTTHCILPLFALLNKIR